MPHQPRALVRSLLGLGERRTRERVDGAADGGRAEQDLPPMDLQREHVRALSELERPGVLRLRPRAKALRSFLIGLFVAGGEERRQRGVLREGEHPPLREERGGLLERLQCTIRRETQIMERSEEHTSELQSHSDLVCRLLLEKKKKENTQKEHQHETKQRIDRVARVNNNIPYLANDHENDAP